MKQYLASIAAALGMTVALAQGPAHAQGGGDQFLGEVIILPYTFCPRGWTDADGKLLSIAEFSALFSLYGTTFGGDGRTTFGVPDLRGRSPMGIGNGPGLTPRTQGQKGGTETVTLNTNQIPSHNHSVTLRAENVGANAGTAQGNILANGNIYATPVRSEEVSMSADSIQQQNVGASQSHNNLMPFSVLRYCVATVGIYPSRN